MRPSSTSTVNTDDSQPRVGKERNLSTHYDGPVIPPSTMERLEFRTIVLCFDGTGDQFDNDNSNVMHFYASLSKGEREQLVYYRAGIRTYTIPQIPSPFRSKITETLDMMFASSIGHHIAAGYEFLMEHYHEGDKICILGFSRGAYTGQALAGMIEKVGLLPAGNRHQVPFAYKLYMEDNEFGRKESAAFKENSSIRVDIEFVGLWDTVDSVGIIPRHDPFTKYNTCVKTFHHAISLDERHAKFKVNMYDKWPNEPTANDDPSPQCPHDHNEQGKEWAQNWQDQFLGRSKATDVLEVWFAGCHADVGGGSDTSGTRYSLARIPLRWMIRQCFLTNCGILFRAEKLRKVGLDPNMLYPEVKARPPPIIPNEVLKLDTSKLDADIMDVLRVINEEYEEYHDAMSPMHDQLNARWMWWILEYLPLVHRVQKEDGSNGKVLSINRGRPRKHIQGHCMKVHRSVKMRMEAEHLLKPYTPRLKFEVEPEWVD